MDTVLMKEYPYQVIDKYVFVKRVYFDYVSERAYIDLLVYTKEYQEDMDYLLDCMDPTRFNEVVDTTIQNFLNERGVSNN